MHHMNPSNLVQNQTSEISNTVTMNELSPQLRSTFSDEQLQNELVDLQTKSKDIEDMIEKFLGKTQ